MVGTNFIAEKEELTWWRLVAIMSLVWGSIFFLVFVHKQTTQGQTDTVSYSHEIPITSTVTPNIDGEYHPLQYTQEDFDIMQEAIYFEARGEPLMCQILVAHVIMARMYDWYYPNTIKEVVWQPYQFSYTQDGKPETMKKPYSKFVAGVVAEWVLSGESYDSIEGSLYYFNPKMVTPKWKDDYDFVRDCGNHSFYKRKGDQRSWG